MLRLSIGCGGSQLVNQISVRSGKKLVPPLFFLELIFIPQLVAELLQRLAELDVHDICCRQFTSERVDQNHRLAAVRRCRFSERKQVLDRVRRGCGLATRHTTAVDAKPSTVSTDRQVHAIRSFNGDNLDLKLYRSTIGINKHAPAGIPRLS